ncbi:CRTAC1 family protein [Actomonas aquatica]|uniref:CRTAC1 family protein n=1 Tax=Actomonas aquatica TaxID=2866162 RepID=A0ABZ1C503_9BACT|nr:CRTAC1 family protein [Opitutus sp. WL0086]WRQ86817.1 CRTAC1 family protein [Opitutus sp. WL0086]
MTFYPGFRLSCPRFRVRRVRLGLGLGLLAIGAAFPPPALASSLAPSTQRMIERLQTLAETSSGETDVFFPGRAVADLEAQLAAATSLNQSLPLRIPYAQALLNDGHSTAALEQIQIFGRDFARSGASMDRQQIAELLQLKALCEFRLGEQANCLANHNADSCLLPLAGGAIHLDQTGSRAAIATYKQVLAQAPSPYAAWMLNLAHMTVGEYPEKVPERWRVPPEVFASDFPLPRFYDVAMAHGVAVDDLSGGVVMDDFDRDGDLDLMASAWGPYGQLRYFTNDGGGTFTERTGEAGLQGLTGGLNLIHGDYNNDGFVDVLILRGAWRGEEGRIPNSLLRNDGDGTFTDVTETAGLLSFHPTQTATWFDYDGDGWLDIFIGNESLEGNTEADPCELYRNNGDGTFTNLAATSGVDVVDWIKAVTAGDYNNDGRPDLYLSSLTGANRLLRNDGPVDPARPERGHRFTDVAAAAGVTEPGRSFPCWFFDYDNDGWLDILVTGYSIRNAGDVLADLLQSPHRGEEARLYRNRGDGTFAEVSAATGLDRILHTMGSNFGDIDNDGWLDFYVGTGDPNLGTVIPNLMFRNDAGRRFQDVTTAGGFGQLQKGHAIAFGDLNHDGQPDIYSVVGGAFAGDHYPNQLFANPGFDHAWLKLRLHGQTSNRLGVGSRILVTVDTPAGPRSIHRVVTSGGTFGSNPLTETIIGLGDATAIKEVAIRWAGSDHRQTLTDLQLNRIYRITEAAGADVVASPPAFEWQREDNGATGGHRHGHFH